MVGLFQRVTTFVLAVVAQRIARYDEERPYSTERQRWIEVRERELGGVQRCAFQQIYLDDGMGLTVLGRGEPATSEDGEPETRAEAHLRIACETFVEAGWGVQQTKVQIGYTIDPLGLTVTTEGRGALACPEVKRQSLIPINVSNERELFRRFRGQS